MSYPRKLLHIYAIDVAFHENGLNYASREETIACILKKMIRTAMILLGYFNTSRGEIIFASPKVYTSISEPLRQCVKELQQLLEGKGLYFNFTLICNEDFKREIFDVVTAWSDSVADTSELFMRSIQMYKLFSDESVQSESISKPRSARRVNTESHGHGLTEMKIGAFVKSSMARLIEQGLLNKLEIERLTQEAYSKRTFNLNYPVLKEYVEALPMSQQRNDLYGRARYYAEPYQIGGKKYLLCNHWVEELSRSYFEAWLSHIEPNA